MRIGGMDLNDAFVAPFYVLFSAASLGVVGFQLPGYDVAEPIIAAGDHVYLSIASIGSIVTLVLAYVSNSPDLSAMGLLQKWVVLATVWLIIAPPFMPAMQTLLGSFIPSLFALILQMAGFYIIGYLPEGGR